MRSVATSAPYPYEHQGKAYDATVTDISGEADRYSLDEHGFCLVNQHTNVTDFLDEKNVQTNYYPEMVELMKKT